MPDIWVKAVNMLCLTNSLDSLHNTRQMDKLNKLKVHTTLRAKCVSIACVKLWNGLRIALRNCTNIFTLKKSILDRYKRDFSETLIYLSY